MLTLNRKQVGRFEEFTLPNGAAVYKEIRGDDHFYHAEIHPSSASEGGYAYVDGSTLTGVSTAAKFLDGDPDPLMGWAAKCDQEGIARIVRADVQSGQSLDWLTAPERIRARLCAEEATWRHERSRRAEEGTNVHHEMVWKLATGEPANLANVTEAERGFGRGVFASFRELGLRGKVEYAEQLTVAFHEESSPVRGIAGTFDLLAADVEVDLLLPHVVNRSKIPAVVRDRDTIRLLADYKTRAGAGKVRKSDHLQVRGYEYCNSQCGLGETDGQVVIIVLPDGTFEVYWCEATLSQWIAAVKSCQESKPLDGAITSMQTAAKVARKLDEEIGEQIAAAEEVAV